MERKINGYIKFKDKKAITRPLDGEQGEVKTWEISDNHNSKEFFRYKGQRYQLLSSVESK